MDQRIIDLHHDYVHEHFDRRRFLEEARTILGSTVAAAALLPLLDCNFANAQTIKADDPRITTQTLSFEGKTGNLNAYLAKPADNAPHPAILVVHEISGLNAHVEDVARRLAVQGYVALAVDFLTPLGGTPPDGHAAFRLAQKLKPANTYANGVEALKYLHTRQDVNGKVGIVGFCWGGRVVQHVAVLCGPNDLDAAVAFYGEPPNPAMAPDLHAPLLMNYADVMLDMNNGGEGILYAQQLKKLGKTYAIYFYPGAKHGFNNETNEARYNAAAAKLAWGRTLDWFKKYLM